MSDNILITGVSGLLGNNLALHFRPENQVSGIYHSHPVSIPGVRTFGVDLADYAETRKLVGRLRPEVVIHCASRTDVDKMEDEKEEAWQANVLTTRVLLDALRDSRAKFVHISTDSVYSEGRGPFKEEGPLAPCNWYGETKFESEKLVLGRAKSLILRTNLYGWNILNKRSLAEWFLERLKNNQQTIGFSNARFSSIYTFLFAEILEKCLKRGLEGVYNCACRDSWTKSEFGMKMADCFGLKAGLILPRSMEESGLKARRGTDLSLCVDRLEMDLGEHLPTMGESLHRFFRDWEKDIPGQIKRGLAEKPAGEFYPVREDISYGGQAIDQADIEAVARVIRSRNLTQGEEVSKFENDVTEFVGAEFGVAVSSGTAALHLACLACDLVAGDEGITSPNTFVASANAIVYCGASPRFADIDPRTYNMSPVELEKRITKNTRVVIPVHFAGQSCRMREIRDVISKKENLFGRKIFVIEDASHVLGSLYKGKKVGCCDYSDAAVFSFHPVKHITTGEGGMVVTNHQPFAERIRTLRTHGITKDSTQISRPQDPWFYEQVELGFNYRITDFQCALGRSQLKKLSWFAARRRWIVETYNHAFEGLPFVTIPFEDDDCRSIFHLYVLQVDFLRLGLSRADMMKRLKAQGILTQVHYIPVHLHKYYRRNFGTEAGQYKIAEEYYEKCLTLPLYPAMDNEDVAKVIHHVLRIVAGGSAKSDSIDV